MRSLNGLLVGVAAVATAGGAATAQQYSSDFTTGLGAASAYGAANFSASGLEAFRITTAASCAADFNRSGVLGVQDIFDFLAAYFTGCP